MTPLFLDIDTQNDFVLPAGALYAPGAERVIPVVGALNRFAVDRGLTLISTACAHSENDPEFKEWPPHCVKGTVGQLKPSTSLVGGAQRIFEKQTTDVFRNERFAPLLQELNNSEYIVYGVVTEVCVKFAADGLFGFGRPITIIADGIQALDLRAGQEFLHRFVNHGGSVITAEELVARL